MIAVELNKERGPIYSRYDRDRADNYSAVIDYAAPPRTTEEIQFMLAHKITPNQADPNDMPPGVSHRYQEAGAPLPSFLESLSNSMAQRTSGQAGNLQNQNVRKKQAQSKVALIGIIIWVLFMLASLLFNVLGR